VMDMLGVPYTYTGMGRDLFSPRFDKDCCTFTMLMDNPPTIGLLDEQYYFRTIPGVGSWLYDYRSKDPAVPNLKDKLPDRFTRMQYLASGLYQEARYLLSHNQDDKGLGKAVARTLRGASAAARSGPGAAGGHGTSGISTGSMWPGSGSNFLHGGPSAGPGGNPFIQPGGTQ
jgi:hypothetical protein